jgi:precorrin-8X/cobalt-precorrin-8 methylmutase
MVAAGIAQDRLPASNAVEVHLADSATTALAERLATTRSAAAVELWRPRLDGAVVAIGNAPTALIHLLDRLREWPERPALILAFPVGFIGAAESKEALIAAELDAPWLTLRGRLGGSAMAAAAVNALFLPEP